MNRETDLFHEFTPGTLQQYIDLVISNLISASLPEIAGMITVTGVLLDKGRASGKTNFNAKITDDGGAQIKVDVPTSILAGRGIECNLRVIAVGRLAVRSTQYGVEVKLVASDIRLSDDQTTVTSPLTPKGSMTIERLKGIRLVRNVFPDKSPIKVELIQSNSLSAQVVNDAMLELEKLGDRILVQHIRINMLDPVALTNAILSADTDILLIIRGGGPESDFEIFNDVRVVDALANQLAYRVIALGHSGNSTLLDVIADFTAPTPTYAGTFVREQVMRQESRIAEGLRDVKFYRERMQAIEKERDNAQLQAKSASDLLSKSRSGVPLWLFFALLAVAITTGTIAYFK